ncbi:TPA: hypothetical protein ACKRKP_000789 [Proteus mirabilis]|uniref:hypothetical protein n=1 Tax=Proteus mirabilis TaxID=584 RepID=UPI0005378FEF|nr:hypothetical protein [Proteus mirabilis]AUT91689.1 hypothetical protein MC46_008180 [Proteus mirabilis]MBG5952275.1 hypothetical protein [Proteus mirabilis]HEK0726551.1 hypothetical protein [Proteus mirabilis]HEK3118218.1 hypothetical protein [Proteus mirabilis]
MTQETYNAWNLGIFAASSIIALLMLFSVRNQIAKAVEANRISKLNSLLSIESQIVLRRQELSAAGIALNEFKKLTQEEKDSNELFDMASLRFNEAVQTYLNSLDRLCYCIIKKYLDDADMKVEYRQIINSAVTKHEDKFGASTPYRNIKKIYDKWSDS